MADIRVPEFLVDLRHAVSAATVALTDHVRNTGPIQAWNDTARAEGIRLQQAHEVAERSLREALAESDLVREYGAHEVRRALRIAAGKRLRRH